VAALGKPLQEALAKSRKQLALVGAREDVEGASWLAVTALFQGVSVQSLPARKVFVGPVTYEESGQGGRFARMLSDQVRQDLTKIEGLTVVEPRERNVENLAQAAKTRELLAASQKGQTVVPMDAPAMQAVIDDAEAALEGRYVALGDRLRVDLSLKQAGTDVLLAAASAYIQRGLVPPGLDVVPPTPVTYEAAPAPTAQPIAVDVTSELGTGRTWQEGDFVSYFVSTNRDAYLLLIYETADHDMMQLLPNPYSGPAFYQAGRFIRIPEKTDVYGFRVAPPFGLERVWAFASSRPFPTLSGVEQGGVKVLEGDMGSVLAAVRASGRSAGAAYGEACTAITTVPRSGATGSKD